LLNYCVQQSPSWKANSFSAGQEIPRVLWNPKIYYSVYSNPLLVPILSQNSPLHALLCFELYRWDHLQESGHHLQSSIYIYIWLKGSSVVIYLIDNETVEWNTRGVT
jgi:hypothetical protein